VAAGRLNFIIEYLEDAPHSLDCRADPAQFNAERIPEEAPKKAANMKIQLSINSRITDALVFSVLPNRSG
jgi:hypothetical protein